MSMATKLMGGVAAACLLAGTGCAFTTETIHIDYPAPVAIEKIKGADSIKVTVEVKDMRSNPSREVAKKINGFGMETAPIFNDEDIQLLVKRSVETELRARGYNLEDGKVPIRIELLTFLHRYNSGFFSGDSNAEVSFVVRVKDAQGRELYSDTLMDAFKHAAGIFGGGNVKQAYEQALPGAIRKLMGKAEFHAALAKAAGGA